MFEIIKSVIFSGGYKLAEIQHKIKKLYILGDLAEAEMDELLVLASGSASADAERPETLQMIHTLAEDVQALKTRVKALEGSEENQSAYPVWKPWDGLSSDYQIDAVVSHNGELWKSVYVGQNVWEPGAPGTESMWNRLGNAPDIPQ